MQALPSGTSREPSTPALLRATGVAFVGRLLAGLVVVALMTGCAAVEDKRMRQLLHDKGFGTRAEGLPSAENIMTGGDAVTFIVDPLTYLNTGAEQLYLITQPQRPSIDGTIFVPYLGPIYVLGMTERELSALVKEQLQALYNFPVVLSARIIDSGKAVYIYGEVEGANYRQLAKPDVTLLELLSRSQITKLANWGRIRVVRPDAENPIAMVVNVREMLHSGNTTYNILLEHNDIIYVPPTFFGHIARLVEKLLEPLNVAVRTLFGAAAVRSSYEVLTGDADRAVINGFRF